MARRHPNKAKMDAAVQRWISEAQGRSNASALILQRAGYIADQIAILGREGATPAHLEGLTVWDLQEAQGNLERAARGLPPLVREPVVTIVFGYRHDGAIVYFGNPHSRPGVHPPYGTLDAAVADGHRFVDDRGHHHLLQMAASEQVAA